MKQTLLIFISLLVALTLAAQVEDFSPQDFSRMEEAIKMVDNGRLDEAIKVFKEMDKKYPNNYSVLYELAFAYNRKHDYKQALKVCERLTDHPWSNHQVYQMMGNILDDMGQPDKAIKAYEDGLKRYPNAGELYLEQGILRMRTEEYNQALACFENAIEVEPNLASPYYYLAKIFSMSTEPVWAIIYGETARLLTLGTDRSEEMSKLLYDMYKENIIFYNGGDSIQVTFTQENTISISPDTSDIRIPLPISFEKEMCLALAGEHQIDLQSLVNIRKRFIENFHNTTNGYYDVSILDFQRKVLESGHWDAYNMWLMMQGDKYSFNKWIDTDSAAEDKLDAFASWYGKNHFEPTLTAPTHRNHIFSKDNIRLPSLNEVTDAAGCREHRDDALRLAKWLFDQPYDTTNMLIRQVQQFLFIWATNSDEVLVQLRPGAVDETSMGIVLSGLALIEYALENNVKNPGEDGYVYAMKRVLNYLNKNRKYISLDEKAERYLRMPPEELKRQLHEDYNTTVE